MNIQLPTKKKNPENTTVAERKGMTAAKEMGQKNCGETCHVWKPHFCCAISAATAAKGKPQTTLLLSKHA